MRRKKDNLINIVLVLVFVAGLSLVLYPSVSNYWNARHQTRAITNYSEKVATISTEEYDAAWEAAREYNRNIEKRMNRFTPTQEELRKYGSLLNFSDNGVMGYIEIPAIDVTLPIYHGTSDSALQKGVGHLEWTSLPVGGEGTHSVLSGHRGLPSAKLFTHLDKLAVGDTFMLRILDEVLTYEVDRINIVEPQDTGDLQCEKGKDYCTLVTCTPYAVNTHRLLVRGHRIETVQQAAIIHITAELLQIDPVIVTAVVGIPLLAVMMAVSLLTDKGASVPPPARQTERRREKGNRNGAGELIRSLGSVRSVFRRGSQSRGGAHASGGAHSRKK